MHPITFFPSLSLNVAPKCHFPFNFQINFFILEGHITRKFTLKNQKISMDKKLDTSSTWHGLRDQDHFCTRLRRDVNYRLTLHQNLAEADVKFELVIFFYIFFILYAINDILLNRITLLRVCAMYLIRIYLSGTQQYNTIQIFYFRLRSPFGQNN